ncbi:MAG: hypothetical protein ACKO9H_12020, partial [Planctomycetota bacterium]
NSGSRDILGSPGKPTAKTTYAATAGVYATATGQSLCGFADQSRLSCLNSRYSVFAGQSKGVSDFPPAWKRVATLNCTTPIAKPLGMPDGTGGFFFGYTVTENARAFETSPLVLGLFGLGRMDEATAVVQ